MTYQNTLPIGLIQTTLDATRAWRGDAFSPTISEEEDNHVWQEISKAMRAFQDGDAAPRIVLLPELSLPRTRLDEFEHLVAALNVIAVVGVDYRIDEGKHHARNEGMVFVPRNFFRSQPSRYCARILFGKTYAARREGEKLRKMTPPWDFVGDHNVYLFDCEQYGTFGASICYDFMDIERALLYRGRVHHLFVLAYNQDLGMFRSLAESLSRTVFCNVVVCNTGHFGGSLAVSPYYEAYRRTVYSHNGGKLFTAQVLQLPVLGIEEAQRGNVASTGNRKTDREFKDRPECFSSTLDPGRLKSHSLSSVDPK
jgi:predicted amidohydrolase